MDKKIKSKKAYLKPAQRTPKPILDHILGPPPTRDIFVSHAAADMSLIDLFNDLLCLGCGVVSGQIFYSSNPDQGVLPGKQMSVVIKEALRSVKMGICIITPNSIGSVFCISERGAIWAMETKVIYLITEPLDFGDVKAPIGEQKILRLMNMRELDTMRDVLCDSLRLPRLPTGDWSKARDNFLEMADPIVQKFNVDRERGLAAIAANLPIKLPQVINLLTRHMIEVRAIVFDIDSMEKINKIHGFSTGSLLLKEVGAVLDNVCSTDNNAIMAHRCGDDTYFLIFRGGEVDAIALAEKVLNRIKHVPVRMRRQDIFVTASCGIARMEWASTAIINLERAYYACAEARRKGGNLVEVNKTPSRLGWS